MLFSFNGSIAQPKHTLSNITKPLHFIGFIERLKHVVVIWLVIRAEMRVIYSSLNIDVANLEEIT